MGRRNLRQKVGELVGIKGCLATGRSVPPGLQTARYHIDRAILDPRHGGFEDAEGDWIALFVGGVDHQHVRLDLLEIGGRVEIAGCVPAIHHVIDVADLLIGDLLVQLQSTY